MMLRWCVLLGKPRSGSDAGYLDAGVLLAVTAPLAVAGLVLVVEDRDLRTLGLAEDLDGDLGTREGRRLRGDRLAVDQQERGELHCAADCIVTTVQLENLTDTGLELTTTTAHDRVHRGP